MVRSPWEVILDQIYYRPFFKHNPSEPGSFPSLRPRPSGTCVCSVPRGSARFCGNRAGLGMGTSDTPVFMLPQINSDFSKWSELGYEMEKTTCLLRAMAPPLYGGFGALSPRWMCSAWKTEIPCNASFYAPLKKEGRL